MAIFTNQATLTYNGSSTNSNIAFGEILDVLVATKTAVEGSYTPGQLVTYGASKHTRSLTFAASCFYQKNVNYRGGIGHKDLLRNIPGKSGIQRLCDISQDVMCRHDDRYR